VGSEASPVLQPAEHDFDAVAAFIAALVVFDGVAARRPSWYAGLYPFVLQRTSEPVSVIAPVSQQPVRFWQTAQQGHRACVIAHLTRSHVEPDRAAIGVGNGMQLDVPADLCATDHTAPLVAWPPFFDCRLVAVRCALR
jgi:hypothetical protein